MRVCVAGMVEGDVWWFVLVVVVGCSVSIIHAVLRRFHISCLKHCQAGPCRIISGISGLGGLKAYQQIQGGGGQSMMRGCNSRMLMVAVGCSTMHEFGHHLIDVRA